MASETDLHVGRRLRRRRRLMGMTQQQLADMVGIRFQQIQKYECGANRMSASRLFDLSNALSIPVQYFYDGLPTSVPAPAKASAANDDDDLSIEILRQKETRELVRAYYQLGERPRRRLLDLAKALQDEKADVA
jgi:transcriptional regulator with XRE-family HTH domain